MCKMPNVLMGRVMHRVKNLVWQILRNIRLRYKRMFVKSSINRTIICNNCLGGVVSSDFGLRFCSPFVNLWIPTNHYIEILNDIASLNEYPIQNITKQDGAYPVGLLNNKWELHFMHYKSFEEAVAKWTQRIKRMDIENMYVICVETHSATYEDMVNFDKLPFKNKITITHKSYPEIKSSVTIKNYDGLNINGEILKPSNKWGMRLYDQINWTDFLNLR